ncbi:MAG: hypothetical protein FWG53_07705 [Clostridiales bacterium]|nr:hypothetical protein [Clostridiales bacterium]
MDFIALTNMAGYAKIGNPQNMRHKKNNRPASGGRQDDYVGIYDDFGISSINMRTQAGGAVSADEKSSAFSDILRAAYSQKTEPRI